MSADVIQLPARRVRNAYTEDFERAWTFKLRPTDNKFTAAKAYAKALTIAPREEIIAGLKAWHRAHRDRPEYACGLAVFFNQRRWEDFDTRPQLEVVEVDIKPLMWEGIGFDLAQKWTCASEWLASGEYGPVYRSWLRHLTLTGHKDGKLLFRAPSKFAAYKINNEFIDILARAVGMPCEVYT